MLLFGFTTLGTRVVASISLAAIALGLSSMNQEAMIFNDCIEELRNDNSISAAVNFCNGGK